MSHLQHLPPDPFARPGPTTEGVFTLIVSSGVVSSGLTLTSVEFEQVLSGGVASANTIDSGGQVALSAGGITIDDMVMSGGSEIVSAGAIAVAIAVSSGGLVSGAGVIDAGVIDGFAAGLQVGAFEDLVGFTSVGSGGTTSALTVVYNGDLDVTSGGNAMATVVNGGILGVDSGGLVSGSVITNGGSIVVEGEADATVVGSGGYAYAEAAGSSATALLSGITVSAGGTIEAQSGSVVSSLNLYAGGLVQLDSAAEAVSATLRGGALSAGFGAVIGGLVITKAGTVTLTGESTSAINVNVASGSLTLRGLAAAEGVALAATGTLIDDGILLEAAILGLPGHEVLAGQITGSGIIAAQIGSILITGDTTGFTGLLVNAGGTIELGAAGGLSRGTLQFDGQLGSSTQTFQIDAADAPKTGSAFAAPIIDFDNAFDRLDLAGVAFVSGATARVSGSTLTLVDGGYTTSFKLSDTRGARYGVESDGKGGTLIKVGTGTPVVLVEAAAGFAGESAAITALSALIGSHADVAHPLQLGAPTRHG